MLKLIKKILIRLRNEIVWKKNSITLFFYTGELKIGKKLKLNQRIKFKNLNGKGKIIIGNNCSLGYKYGGGYYSGRIEIQTRKEAAEIIIGNNVSTNNNLYICSREKIEIKDNVLIGRNVVIMDHNGHGIDKNKRNIPGTARSIKIEKNVWIGNYVTILPGTIIGENSIVSVGSVVKGEFPENVIIGGNPAKIIKKIGD